MPFLFICRECNYRIYSNYRKGLNEDISLHFRKSHKKDIYIRDIREIKHYPEINNLFYLYVIRKKDYVNTMRILASSIGRKIFWKAVNSKSPTIF